MKLSKQQREQLRNKFGGRCAYCGCELTEKWHADHLKAVIRESKFVKDKDGVTRTASTGAVWHPQNECIENLMPSCAPCNLDKQVLDIEVWRSWLQDRMIDSMRKNIPNFRHALRFGLVSVNSGPVVFWFERFQFEKAS